MRKKLSYEYGPEKEEVDSDKQEIKGKGMRIVFLGPPGSGKGTYASRIGPELEIPHIAVGDIFRKAINDGTPAGLKAKKYYDEGKTVPNEISTGIIIERIKKPDCKRGFILDSPYNEEQAKEIDKVKKIDLVINLNVPEDFIILRLSTRRVCRKCGTIYNIRSVKPKVEGKCDKCGGELYQRDDDKPEAIRKRLKVYEERAGPLIDYYRKRGVVIEIGCDNPDIPPEIKVEEIIKRISDFMEE